MHFNDSIHVNYHANDNVAGGSNNVASHGAGGAPLGAYPVTGASAPHPYSIGADNYNNSSSSTSSIKVWYYQHDTVYLNIEMDNFIEHKSTLRIWKEKAQQEKERRYEIPGVGCFMEARGSVHYPYVIDVPDMCIIQCSFSTLEEVKSLRVHVRSEYLYKCGGRVAGVIDGVTMKVGALFGYENIKDVQVGDLDLCLDFTGWCPTFDDVKLGRFVGRNKKAKINDWEAEEITSMNFGQRDSPVFVRLYDKRKEIEEESHKLYLLEEYKRRGYSSESHGRMMRLEVHFGREALRQGGIEAVADIDDAALLRYAFGDGRAHDGWLSLRSVNESDSNKWRWEVSPVWLQIAQQAVQVATSQDDGVLFVRDYSAAANEETLIRMVVGCSSSYAALAGKQTFYGTFRVLLRRCRRYIEQKGIDYNEAVKDKRLRYKILSAA